MNTFTYSKNVHGAWNYTDGNGVESWIDRTGEEFIGNAASLASELAIRELAAQELDVPLSAVRPFRRGGCWVVDIADTRRNAGVARISRDLGRRFAPSI
jgi:hypothetical protein